MVGRSGWSVEPPGLRTRSSTPALMSSPSFARTAALTLLTLVAFAANSLLCRAALGENAIDPVAFTAIRMEDGAEVSDDIPADAESDDDAPGDDEPTDD